MFKALLRNKNNDIIRRAMKPRYIQAASVNGLPERCETITFHFCSPKEQCDINLRPLRRQSQNLSRVGAHDKVEDNISLYSSIPQR